MVRTRPGDGIFALRPGKAQAGVRKGQEWGERKDRSLTQSRRCAQIDYATSPSESQQELISKARQSPNKISGKVEPYQGNKIITATSTFRSRLKS